MMSFLSNQSKSRFKGTEKQTLLLERRNHEVTLQRDVHSRRGRTRGHRTVYCLVPVPLSSQHLAHAPYTAITPFLSSPSRQHLCHLQPTSALASVPENLKGHLVNTLGYLPLGNKKALALSLGTVLEHNSRDIFPASSCIPSTQPPIHTWTKVSSVRSPIHTRTKVSSVRSP